MMTNSHFKDSDLPEYVDHKIAINSIAEKHNLDPKIVKNTLKVFLNCGLKYYLSNQIPLTIVGFANFSVNQTGREIIKRRLRAKQIGHNGRMKKFMRKWRAKKAGLA